MNSTEFSEIEIVAADLEFARHADGGVSVGLSHTSPSPITVIQMAVSFGGRVHDIVPVVQFFEADSGVPVPSLQPTVPVLLVSDKQMLFGRRCPSCKSYFRTDHVAAHSRTLCPYCLFSEKSVNFLTNNQAQYLLSYLNKFLDLYESEEESFSINMASIAKDLESNKQGWIYTEEQQQRKFKCKNCKATFDVLGEYVFCPKCCQPTAPEVIEEKIGSFQQLLNKTSINHHSLSEVVTSFEKFGKSMLMRIGGVPISKKRRKKIGNLNFQDIGRANGTLKEIYDIDFFEDVSSEDQKYLSTMFNRRHLFVHNSGVVDQRYLDRTSDMSVKLNQKIRFLPSDMERILPIFQNATGSFATQVSELISNT